MEDLAMIPKEAIDAALAAHTQWKKRLQDAVASGRSDFKVNDVRKDNVCEFGRWLYGLSESERQINACKEVMGLHAEFHKTAAEILELALQGKKEDAQKQLEYGGTYSHISGKLVLALNAWKNSL